MKYSTRHILNVLNDNIYMKEDMKEEYRFSELPILKHMTELLYSGESEYNKLTNKFVLIHDSQLRLPNYLPETIQTVIHDMKIVKYAARFNIQDRIFDVYMHFDGTKKYMNHENEEYREILFDMIKNNLNKERKLAEENNEFYVEYIENELLVGEAFESRAPLFQVKCINDFKGVIEKDKIYNVYSETLSHYEIYRDMMNKNTYTEYCKNFILI